MESHILGTKYGYTYRRCNIWGIIKRVNCTEIYIEGSFYVEYYRG